MNCPLTSRCHTKLSNQLAAARAAHQKTIREDSEAIRSLEHTCAVQQFQIEHVRPPMEDFSKSGRRKLSGYVRASCSPYPKTNCGNCENMASAINYHDRERAFCGDYLHPVDKLRGSCPHHSDLMAAKKRKVA